MRNVNRRMVRHDARKRGGPCSREVTGASCATSGGPEQPPARIRAAMAGHLFITRGDIRRLACQAWLLPTDRDVTIEPIWRRGDPRIAAALQCGCERRIRDDSAWQLEDVRAMRMLASRHGRPEVWLGNVGGIQTTDVRWTVEAVAEFVRLA